MQISDKKQLRALYKKQRLSMDKAQKQGSDKAIAQRFLESELYKNCVDLLIYVSFGIEVDTIEIIKQVLGEKNVYCPRCVAGTNIMEFFKVTSFDDFEQGSYGILEPAVDSGAVDTFADDALCVVPALSYDNNGYRLGFGKGFYDRFLSGFDGCTVGLCYESFLTDTLPHDEFDICVDHLITECKTVDFGLRKEEIYG